MPDYTKVKKTTLASLCGLSLLAGTFAYADQMISERTQVRNADLSGGFYDDRYTADDWFYDFYDAPADRTDPRVTERAKVRDTDPMTRAERDRLADAAHPIPTGREFPRPNTAADTAYSRYYDEPWFYEDRDPAYAMPMTTGRSESYHPAARDEEYIKGTVQAVKNVRNRQSGGQNAVALVRMNDGRRVIADLGPTQRTLNFALTQGDAIQVGGQREEIGPYSVLMAHDIKSGANRVRLNRDVAWREADYRQVDGTIERFRDIKTRPNGQLHRTAAVRTEDGRFAIVDMGPSPAENVPANAAPGDRMTASGQVVQVGNYSVLLADRLSINNGLPVRVVRPDSEYVEPTRRPFEASQGQSAADPSCVGGGCESGTVDRSTPRNPLSNATDGNVRSDRQ
jgi:hypothetical protein